MGDLFDKAVDIGTGGAYGAITGKGFDVTGKGAAKEQAGKARQDIMAGKGEALGYLDQSYGTQNALTQPVADLYQQYMPQLANMGRNPAQDQIDAISMYGTPQLQSSVDFNLEADPIYQQQREQMMKALNRRMASQGGYASSDADNALIRNLLPFMQDSYGRGLDTLNRSNQNALTQYGLGMDRENTLYGMNNQQNQQQYDRLGNMVNIGLSGINSLAGNAQQYGQNRANIATGTSNAMAENRYALGQLGIATSPLNTLATIGSTAAKLYGAGGA